MKRFWLRSEWKDEEAVWRSAAISLAIFTPVLVFVAVIFLLAQQEPEEIERWVAIFTPFGAIYLAMVTFCTVVWRGLLSARQVEIQNEQLKSLARQITASEEGNLAQQLQKGAELISENNSSKVGAGIALLGAVAKAEADRFGDQARSLLLNLIIDKGNSDHRATDVKRATAALRSAFEHRGSFVSETVQFDEDPQRAARADDARWEIVTCVESVTYRYGYFENQIFTDDVLPHLQFLGVSFVACTIKNLNLINGKKCTFYKCRIDKASSLSLAAHTFKECDLSGAAITVNAPLPDLRPTKNFYQPERPVRIVDNPGPPIKPQDILHEWALPDMIDDA